MIYLNPSLWQWNRERFLPGIKDVRWIVLGLLSCYLILGTTVLGFSRQPGQILMVVGLAGLLDFLFSGLFRGKIVFPLSGLISSLSLAILLNYTMGYEYLWIPVFITIASKYLITIQGKHIFNPSMFGIVICLLFSHELITLSPSYQWYGSAESAWAMGVFIVTSALFLVVLKINRNWLILSFLFFFTLQSILRGVIMEHIIPFETILLGSLISPAFFLFTFFMITDPTTSPSGKKEQILVGFGLAAFDLYFHTKASLFTFFYAGITVAAIRFTILAIRRWRSDGTLPFQRGQMPKWALTLVLLLPFVMAFNLHPGHQKVSDLRFEKVENTGIGWAKSPILEELDPALLHVAKWILSVGDAVATADIDLDGDQDVYLSQPLKSDQWRGKLYLNEGEFVFTPFELPALTAYSDNYLETGLPAFGMFFDYDNDGDPDFLAGFGFGKSHLFENRIIPDDSLWFRETAVPYFLNEPTVCLSANAFDFDNDGWLDLMVGNTLPPYLQDYPEPVPFNIFALPKPAYEGDRRMLHFMHESWHNANNGGLNHLLQNDGKGNFVALNSDAIGIPETRWTLAIGTADFNQDGYTDLYLANDFGRDDCYLNQGGKSFVRQQGRFYGEVGLDTYKGMNTSIGDVDGNGKEDVYISNVHHAMQAEGSLLWLNQTPDQQQEVVFQERASQMNVLNVNRFGWGASMGDLNLDGWLDIVQVNGMVDDSWDKRFAQRTDYWYYQAQIARTGPEIHAYADKWADIRGMSIYDKEKDRVYLNEGGKGFVDASELSGLDHEANTRGVANVDLDNDGDLDLVITDQFGAPLLYRNTLKDQRWLGLSLVGNGRSVNRDAVGTKVYLSYEENGVPRQQYREQRLVNGFLAQGDKRMLFGLGSVGEEIQGLSLRIVWPDGTTETRGDLLMNSYSRIEQALSLP